MEDAILFCGRDKHEYPWLSNFYMCKIIDDSGRVWRSAEHLYQAMKFMPNYPGLQEVVREAITPKDAKKVANDFLREFIAEDWHDIKVAAMHLVILCKFGTNEKLKEKLLATGDTMLIEHAHWDSFWGSGEDMKGENWTGKLIMRVRDELRKN